MSYQSHRKLTAVSNASDATAPAPNSSDKTPIDVTYGYSKANRPDLKQVVLNLATTGVANFFVD